MSVSVFKTSLEHFRGSCIPDLDRFGGGPEVLRLLLVDRDQLHHIVHRSTQTRQGTWQVHTECLVCTCSTSHVLCKTWLGSVKSAFVEIAQHKGQGIRGPEGQTVDHFADEAAATFTWAHGWMYTTAQNSWLNSLGRYKWWSASLLLVVS